MQENYFDTYTGRTISNVVNGVTTIFEYNNLGNVTKTTFADDSFTTNTFDGPRLLSQVSRTGVTNSFAFDALGRRTAVTNGLGKVTQFEFDNVSNVTNTIDALSYETAYDMDVMNRLTETTLPDSRVSTNTFDLLGRLTARAGAGSVPVAYEYLDDGKMSKLIDGESNETEFFYGCCWLEEKVYADGSGYSYGYLPQGWLDLRIDPKGLATEYGYSRVGQLTNVNYQSDTDIQYFYDILGRMTQRVDAAGTWSWTYDGESSRVLSGNTPYSQTVSYSYSADKDLVKVALDATNYTEYAWHQGRLTNVTCNMGSFAYSYKPNSDLLETTTYLGGTVTVSRTYDDLNRLLSISATSAVSAVNSFSYTLDSTGRRTARTDADSSQTSWGYDSRDQLTSATRTNGPNGAADAAYDFGYQYDEVGNRLHEDRKDFDLDATFNALNQLTYRDWSGRLAAYGSVDDTNAVMIVGGVTSAPPYFNSTNWLGGGAVNSAGSNSIPIVANVDTNSTQTNLTVYMPPEKPQEVLWDQNGNLTNDGYRAMSWSEENRLVEIETTAAAVSDGAEKRKSTFVYDGMGRRSQKTDYSGWNGSTYSTTNVTTFVYDGWNLIHEVSSTVTNYYVWGQDLSQSLQGAGGIGGLLCVVRNGVPYFPCFDGNGNVMDYIDGTGAVVAHREYDPFGRTVVSTGPMKDDFSFWFSTKYEEPFWKIYYYGYRHYSPETGRWLSRDPIGEDEGLNLYVVAANRPTLLFDPLGLARYKINVTPNTQDCKKDVLIWENTCGVFSFGRKTWVLDTLGYGGIPRTGNIRQKIVVLTSFKKCDAGDSEWSSERREFWEAGPRKERIDMWNEPDRPEHNETRGSITVHGEAYFNEQNIELPPWEMPCWIDRTRGPCMPPGQSPPKPSQSNKMVASVQVAWDCCCGQRRTWVEWCTSTTFP